MRLLPALRVPLISSGLSEKELRLHLCFLPVIDPMSRPLCVGGEKSKLDVSSHQYREL